MDDKLTEQSGDSSWEQQHSTIDINEVHKLENGYILEEYKEVPDTADIVHEIPMRETDEEKEEVEDELETENTENRDNEEFSEIEEL